MQFYLAGWSKLEDKDLTAIATFVKSIPPIKNKVAKSTFKPNAGPPGPPAEGAVGAAGGKDLGAGQSRGGAPGTGGVKGAADAMKPPEPAGAKAKKPTSRAPVKKQEDPDAGGE